MFFEVWKGGVAFRVGGIAQQAIHYDHTSVANRYRTIMNSFSGRFGFVLVLTCYNNIARLHRVPCRWSRRGAVRVATARSCITNSHQLQSVIM